MTCLTLPFCTMVLYGLHCERDSFDLAKQGMQHLAILRRPESVPCVEILQPSLAITGTSCWNGAAWASCRFGRVIPATGPGTKTWVDSKSTGVHKAVPEVPEEE